MDTFSALSDPTRRQIVELLAYQGQLSASAIAGKFIISPQAISQHLKILLDTSLVQVEKRAQQRIYQVNPITLQELEVWIQKMTKQWDDRFTRLDKILKQEKQKKGGK